MNALVLELDFKEETCLNLQKSSQLQDECIQVHGAAANNRFFVNNSEQ